MGGTRTVQSLLGGASRPPLTHLAAPAQKNAHLRVLAAGFKDVQSLEVIRYAAAITDAYLLTILKKTFLSFLSFLVLSLNLSYICVLILGLLTLIF